MAGGGFFVLFYCILPPEGQSGSLLALLLRSSQVLHPAQNNFQSESPWTDMNINMSCIIFRIVFLLFYPSYLTFCWTVQEPHIMFFTFTLCLPRSHSAPAKTICQEEAAAAPRKLGSHRPQCDEQGQYKPIQCWHAIGYCWCVDSNGVVIEGTTVHGRPVCPRGKTHTTATFLRKAVTDIISILFVYFSGLSRLCDVCPQWVGRPEGWRWVHQIKMGSLQGEMNRTDGHLFISFYWLIKASPIFVFLYYRWVKLWKDAGQ